jgi:hypothetical protein
MCLGTANIDDGCFRQIEFVGILKGTQHLEAAQKFVDGYNSLVGTIKSLGKYDPSTSTGGPLLGDAMLRNIESQVRNLISAPVSGVAGSYNTLASLGILTQADGTLKLDTDKFNKALIANPGSVTSIFASDNGVAVKLANLMGSKTSTTGELTVRSSDITDSLQGLKDDQDALDARMKIVQDRYYKQFNALDTLLAQLKTAEKETPGVRLSAAYKDNEKEYRFVGKAALPVRRNATMAFSSSSFRSFFAAGMPMRSAKFFN